MKTEVISTKGMEVLSFCFVLYYSYTGFSKLWDYGLFITLSRYQPLVQQLPVAWMVVFPLSELLIAALLLFPVIRPFVFSVLVFSFLFITGYRLYYLLKGQHLPCICGPYIRKLSESRHLVFNGLLLAGSLAGAVFFYSKTKPSLL